ncbi:hypothetical protein [Pedobacter nyackensis]|uniref:Uncharacterized protein n=1 Tax=Pedobacter nyackensis TaxID=475255 RepID=A0A1W1ZX53_9SPHI|nr:hypothetical protein [Pedobacter nyackensis]SMC52987.1 hypothetical protein SAMN04488101_101119 [Pedobacter nyackensis]
MNIERHTTEPPTSATPNRIALKVVENNHSVMDNILSHEHNGKSWLFIKMPENYVSKSVYMGYVIFKVWNEKNGVTENQLSDYSKLTKYLENHNPDKEYKTIPVKLPEGDWISVSGLSEITEEQAKDVVLDSETMLEIHENGIYRQAYGFVDYTNGCDGYESTVKSLRTLITSLGGDVESNNYLILKEA